MKKSQPLPNIDEEPFVNVERGASVLGCSPGVVYRLVNSGELEAVRVGRLLRIPTSELHRLAGRPTQ